MLSIRELTDLLMFFPVVREMPVSLREALQRQAVGVEADAGEALFHAGDACEGFMLLTCGSVRVIRPMSAGRGQILYRVAPGEACTLSACCMLHGGRLPAGSIAETRSTAVCIPAELFRQLIDEFPPFRTFVLHSLTRRVLDMVRVVEEFGGRNLEQRLASLLLAKGYPIRLTHRALADELGTAREVVSRILKDFERRGAVRLERRQVYVLDEARLEASAHAR